MTTEIGGKRKRATKTFHDKVSNDKGFVSSPKHDINTNSFVYPGLEVFETDFRGLGLRATQKLIPGFLFPLGGVFRNDATCVKNAFKNAGKNTYTNYLVELKKTYNKKLAWLDCHDRMYSGEIKYAWIGKYVNEPIEGEHCNVRMITITDGHIPRYPYMCKNMNVFFLVTETVDPGVELLGDYQYSRSCYKRLNYFPAKFGTKLSNKVGIRVRTREVLKVNYRDLNKTGKIIEE
jgi:hypothetical protein